MATINQEINQRLTLAELQDTMEYRHLSPKMGSWLSAYVQKFLDTGTFDPLCATQAAYKCNTPETARTFGYQLLANPKIILALNRFFGTTPEQAFLKSVEKAIYNRRLTNAQVRALELDCKVHGFDNSLPKKNGYVPISQRPRKYKVADIATRDDGKKFRVTAVTADGRLTAGDPIEE